MLRFLRLQERNHLEVAVTAPTQVVVVEKGVILVVVEIEKEVDILGILLQEKKGEEEVVGVALVLLKEDLMLLRKEKGSINSSSLPQNLLNNKAQNKLDPQNPYSQI